MSTITEITTDADFHSHLSSLPPTSLLIISFHTPWAAPCAQMATVLSTLAASYPATTPPTTSWISLNAEELPDISDSYDVTAVPLLVLLRAGAVLDTISGSDASKVRSAIEKHANASSSKSTKSAGSTSTPQVTIASPSKSQNGSAKNLSAYAPTSTDPKTAPEMTSAENATSNEDLHTRLEGLVKAAPVMLFMKGTPSSPQCGFSRQLVALLRENSVRYGFFNILADDEVRQGLKEFADWPTFPQLWVDGELVGGLDIVKEEIANNPEFLSEHQAVKSQPVAQEA